MAYKKAQSRPNFRWPLCPNLRQPAAETFCVGSFKGQLSFQYQWLSNYGRFVEFWGLVLQNAILEKDLAPREIQIDYFLKDYKCFRPFENAFELGKVSSFWTCIPNLCILWRNFTHLCTYLALYLTMCNMDRADSVNTTISRTSQIFPMIQLQLQFTLYMIWPKEFQCHDMDLDFIDFNFLHHITLVLLLFVLYYVWWLQWRYCKWRQPI